MCAIRPATRYIAQLYQTYFGLALLVSHAAVLYNFEHIPRHRPPEESSMLHSGQRDKSLVSARTLQIYATFTLWDYSEGNVDNLLDFGIHAELIPLGFSAALGNSYLQAGAGERKEDIDVLFIGMETPMRKATIQRLRDSGVVVVHPNSAGRDLYGVQFDELSARSKIVLNLNAFGATKVNECSSSSRSSEGNDETTISDFPCDSTSEWKMPRIARLLSIGRWEEDTESVPSILDKPERLIKRMITSSDLVTGRKQCESF